VLVPLHAAAAHVGAVAVVGVPTVDAAIAAVVARIVVSVVARIVVSVVAVVAARTAVSVAVPTADSAVVEFHSARQEWSSRSVFETYLRVTVDSMLHRL